MTQHIEDCPARPSQRKKKLCPACKSLMLLTSNGLWVCANERCDFELEVVPGGKLQ